ncbi:MAG: nuclear transport factor 2 family protein [Jatrophihabitans sp.]|uniref:nuclear transport factor 2 family protein n=1 Tax=Jatrophihabitans sp. TaxID=1932789 RepID=UPI003F81D000
MDATTLAELSALKYRYLRCVDLKDWDGLADTLTADVDASYGDRLAFTGRDAVVDYMRSTLGPQIITVHQVHHPELSADGDVATGRWYLDDRVLVLEHRLLITGAAFYEDTYRREADGRWRIARTGYIRSYEAMEPLPEGWQLTANRWAEAAAGQGSS